MKKVLSTLALYVTALAVRSVLAGDLTVVLQPDPAGLVLSFRTLDSGGELHDYQLERSEDLIQWSVLGPPVRTAIPDQTITRSVEAGERYSFYRVRVAEQVQASALASGGEDVFGYSALFAESLKEIGQISPQQFAALYPPPGDYLPELTWDPTTADFWPAFNVDPAAYNVGLIRGVDDLRQFNFRLNSDELAKFKKNGFVVSERLGAYSCGEVYSRIWIDDLPVLITTDSILHAWHRSYDMMVAEVEQTVLMPALSKMLDAMALKIAAAEAQLAPVLRESLLDADYFIAVARSLLGGSRVSSTLGQDSRVQASLASVVSERLDACFDLFGAPRGVDFSQFKPRGRYAAQSVDVFGPGFQNYFRAMMWLGRIDFRVAGGPYRDSECRPPHMAPPRELGTSIILHWLLRESGMLATWLESERILQTFVGWTDSMTPPQLGELLVQAGIQTLSDIADADDLDQLQQRIASGQLGLQNINADYFVAPLGGPAVALPQSFTFIGQKFVLDSWALSQVVSDRIRWVENGVTNLVDRRVPSALDIAFSVFGNDHTVPNLVDRMRTATTNYPSPFRDGLDYQHNLAAVRAVVDQHPSASWTQNIYMNWLHALRQLSPSVGADSRMPDAMRSRAWALKDLNTQLASWTQLRHDTILYSKQSYTTTFLCSYPKGFVEPRPEFWRAMQNMAARIASLDLRQPQVEFLKHFAGVCGTLLQLAEKQLRQEPFTDADNDFISTTLVGYRGYLGYWTIKDGWYPKLFYRSEFAWALSNRTFDEMFGVVKWDPIVADVHTDLPCGICNDPGSVLHEAVGNANLLLIAINNGSDRCIYAGPVLSHYEFPIIGSPQRLSDQDWEIRLAKAGLADPSVAEMNPYRGSDSSGVPPPPEWTREFLSRHRR